MEDLFCSNKVVLIGTAMNSPEFNHTVCNESFYSFKLQIPRLSCVYDVLNITVSEDLMEKVKIIPNNKYIINGEFRSYNNYSNYGSKLILTVFSRSITEVSENPALINPNQILLNGYICKMPIYRVTPFGREIADILLAVNRSYNKSDYIPCIAWGKNARFASSLNIGDNIKISGRVQSREYQKKLSDESVVNKIAYEVSINKVEKILKNNNEVV